jgi:hypothetical protein
MRARGQRRAVNFEGDVELYNYLALRSDNLIIVLICNLSNTRFLKEHISKKEISKIFI